MKCRHFREALSQALDGELAPAQRAELDRHCAVCAECRAALESWRAAGDLLRREQVPVPPAEVMWMDVRRAIRQRDERSEPALPAWRLRWAAGLVGLTLLAFGLWGSLRPGERASQARAQVEPAVEWADAELPGASTLVYEDAERDTVVIWLMTVENGESAPKGT